MSLVKFLVVGGLMAMVFWGVARIAAVQFAVLPALRDEATLAVLIMTGAVVYGVLILILFGRKWLRGLVRG